MPEMNAEKKVPEKFKGQHELFDYISAFLVSGGIWFLLLAIYEYELDFIWPIHKFIIAIVIILLGWLM
jgi:hypothetical protein